MNSVLVTPYWVDQTSLEKLAADGISLILESDVTRLNDYTDKPLRAIVVNADGDLTETPHLCKQIRQQFKDTLLFAATAHYPDARLAAIQAGADELLTAPLDWVELRWRLKQLEHPTHDDQYWGGISNILIHDLKSPLGTTVSSLEVLRELIEEDEQGQHLIDNSLRAVRRQSELLDDGLDYLLIRSQSYHAEIQQVSLSEVVNFVKNHLSPMLEMKEMILEINISEDLPPIRADHHLMIRVLKALIDNAAKFCLRKSILKLEAWVEETLVMVQLTDPGRPILSDFEADLFNLSRQWEARIAGSRSTVALNLPFAKAALQLMGGDITASTMNGITAFKLHIPLVTE